MIFGPIQSTKIKNVTPTHHILKCLCILFLCITTLAVFIPLTPNFPQSGLDPSWIFSMQQALAQNLIFGKDIVFTVGPYAAIITKMYHPFTDILMIWGSFFLGTCYTILLFLLARGISIYWLLLYSILLSGFIWSRDALFFSYPFLLTLIVYRATLPNHHCNKLSFSKPSSLILFIILFLPFGLLPLIKSSLLLICEAVAILCASFLWWHKQKMLTVIAITIPIISILLFWHIVGQPIWALKDFFLNTYQVVSAYSEAMASVNETKQVIFYLVSCCLLIFCTAFLHPLGPRTSRFFLVLSYALFLFIAFKEGFVRHDGHAITSATALFIAVSTILLLLRKEFSLQKSLIICILFPILTAIYINKKFCDFSLKTTTNNIKTVYIDAYHGLNLRFLNSIQLKEKFIDSLKVVHEEFPIPILSGTTDIYSYNQAWLFASNNVWSPRMTPQSHGAYTQKLAQINLQHLQGTNSPDNILFRVEPIDNRLPALEDGISWPTLINNYFVTRFENNMLYLRKRLSIDRVNPIAENAFYHAEPQLNEEILLPKTNQPLFAKIELKSTWIGKIATLLFKSPQLQIYLHLKDGSIKDYRVTSGMMISGFIITPLIKDTKDFAILTSPENAYLTNNTVKSIKITTNRHFSLLWHTSYSIDIYKLNLTRDTPIKRIIEVDKFVSSIPGRFYNSLSTACDISIDYINNQSPNQNLIAYGNILGISGWAAVSAKNGILAEAAFITLTDERGKKIYIKPRQIRRPDLPNAFNQPHMRDAGITTYANTTHLRGKYILSMILLYKNNLINCSQSYPLMITHD